MAGILEDLRNFENWLTGSTASFRANEYEDGFYYIPHLADIESLNTFFCGDKDFWLSSLCPFCKIENGKVYCWHSDPRYVGGLENLNAVDKFYEWKDYKKEATFIIPAVGGFNGTFKESFFKYMKNIPEKYLNIYNSAKKF